jgi:subtilisin family serine protease
MSALLFEPPPSHAASADYVVVLRSGVSVQDHLKALKITPNRVYQSGLSGYEAVLNDTQYQRVLASPDVTIVNPNDVVATIPAVKTPPPGPQPAQVPSFAVRRIGALQSPTAKIDGVDERVNVDVAVVDTGVDASHPDLNVVGGVDCQGNSGAFVDKLGHGTMVAGLVGAIDNSIGRVGVAPGARIWSVQVSTGPHGFVTDAALLCAIDWVTAHASTIEVANLSLGGALKANQQTENCGIAPKKVNGDPIHAAICASVSAGVTYAVSAGNDSIDAATVYPASYDEVIAASAMGDSDGQPGGLGPGLETRPCPLQGFTMADDTFAYFFSNFGGDVDLAAPGVCDASLYPGGLYANDSGTSFSSPLVAGAAALYKAKHPTASPAAVRAALLSVAEPGPIPNDPDTSHEGVVNVSTL